ncbi:MAG: ABC transporter ATP-binding protein [Chloroflexi bacterium UTCFX4]|jgi:putative ABC transport system ATP-binding protein|nr:MAG: ABC transporter ATP-binding protein [Chloroflexi bacterium UTCFX4]
MTDVMIDAQNVTRVYTIGARMLYALRAVSAQIRRGEFVAVVGPSGSGKSTLLNLVGGIDKPTSGQMWVDGARIDTLSENALAKWRRNHIGIVFQFFQLLPTLTALENVTLPMELRGDAARGRRPRAQAMLERVGLGARMEQLPSELSGGEQQRVALARALVNDPPILLADEPTGNLDTANAASIIALLRELADAGKTILLITHEANLARAAHRIILMRDGEIVGE